MKILHVITGLATGGAETMLYKLVSNMERSRFDSVVVSLMDQGVLGADIVDAGVPLYCLGMRRGVPSPTALWRLRRVMREVRPDLVQGWMYHGNIGASVGAWGARARVPVLWNIRHSLYDLRKEKRLTALVIRAGAWLSYKPVRILYNAHVSAAQHESLGYKPEKTQVIPNGFDCEQFLPSQEAREMLRAELNVPRDALLIGLIARYHPMKDHANFLRAAALVGRERDEVHFVLAGRGIDPGNAELTALIEDLDLAGHVHLLGERRETPVIFAALDIASTSSAWGEAFPLVIGEAMACGVPCVTTDVGDAAEVVGETGLVVRPQDPDALATAWRELAALDGDARTALGATARHRIVSQYSLGDMVRRYEELYTDLLSG